MSNEELDWKIWYTVNRGKLGELGPEELTEGLKLVNASLNARDRRAAFTSRPPISKPQQPET